MVNLQEIIAGVAVGIIANESLNCLPPMSKFLLRNACEKILPEDLALRYGEEFQSRLNEIQSPICKLLESMILANACFKIRNYHLEKFLCQDSRYEVIEQLHDDSSFLSLEGNCNIRKNWFGTLSVEGLRTNVFYCQDNHKIEDKPEVNIRWKSTSVKLSAQGGLLIEYLITMILELKQTVFV